MGLPTDQLKIAMVKGVFWPKSFILLSWGAMCSGLSFNQLPTANAAPDPASAVITPPATSIKYLSPRPPKFATLDIGTLHLGESNSNPPTISQNLHLIIRLSDRRVYVYQDDQLLTSYPIAVGRAGWETPVGNYQVIQMIQNPTWEHPLTGEIIPPGPDNPLGLRWIGFWTDGKNFIGFHGTPNTETVGQAASHGCIRMFNQDVLTLFEKVKLGTSVTVEP